MLSVKEEAFVNALHLIVLPTAAQKRRLGPFLVIGTGLAYNPLPSSNVPVYPMRRPAASGEVEAFVNASADGSNGP